MKKSGIGFIGLGIMGGSMVENLQNKGYELTVYDRNPKAAQPSVDRGAVLAKSVKELAEKSDIIMLCVTTSKIVESLIYAEDGILSGIKKSSIVIDYGTSLPASTRKIGADLAKKGVGMIDAALGRTPTHAKKGLLNIMGAGDLDTFKKVRPILEDQAENIFHLGALGAGHTAKSINNFMGMTTVCAMSQAFAIATLAGVDRQQLFDIMSTGPSNSPFMHFCKNYAVDGKSNLDFSIVNANKDLDYYLKMVQDFDVETQIAEGTFANLKGALAEGMGDRDVPEIYDYFLKLKKE